MRVLNIKEASFVSGAAPGMGSMDFIRFAEQAVVIMGGVLGAGLGGGLGICFGAGITAPIFGGLTGAYVGSHLAYEAFCWNGCLADSFQDALSGRSASVVS